MVVNPAGPVPIFDGFHPDTITVRASVGVTGGQLVYLSGVSNSLSSGANSYVTNDIVIGGAGSGRWFNGLITTPGLTPSGTNNYVAIATAGAWLITSAGTILGGEAVYANGGDAVIGRDIVVMGSYTPIGRALSPAGSEGYSLVKLF